MVLLLVFILAQGGAEEAYRRGVSLLEGGKEEEAIGVLEGAVKLAPKNARYWKTLGVAHAKVEDYRGSVEPFRVACELDEKLVDACYYSGRAYYAADQYEKSVEPLKKALKVDGVKGRAEAALGQVYEALGEAREAERWLKSAVGRGDGANQTARLAYSRFLVRQGRAGEAVGVAEKAQRPETAESRFELGLALAQCERVEEALKELERALTLRPDNEEAFVLRGKLRARVKAR
jgi:tetratricopeptide (TPR) repeat protein